MVNSKAKGKRAELAIAHYFQDHGFPDAHRTAQVMGKTGGCADVEGVPKIHVEVKHNEHLNIYDAIAQAVRDSGANKNGNLPAVFHKKNGKEWLVTMRIDDWFQLYRWWMESLNQNCCDCPMKDFCEKTNVQQCAKDYVGQ